MPVVFKTPVLVELLLLLVPLQLPLAVHDVGLLATDQDMVELLPVVMDMGFADMLITGAGTLLTVSGTLFA